MEPKNFNEAIADLRNRPFCQSSTYIDQQHRADREFVHPTILVFETLFNRRMRKLDIPVFANEMLRSAKRQKELFKKGYSKIETAGPHQIGCAVDIIHGVHAWDIPEKAWQVFEHVGKEIITTHGFKIRWGGDFKTLWDPAHWEMEQWRWADTSIAGYRFDGSMWNPET